MPLLSIFYHNMIERKHLLLVTSASRITKAYSWIIIITRVNKVKPAFNKKKRTLGQPE